MTFNRFLRTIASTQSKINVLTSGNIKRQNRYARRYIYYKLGRMAGL